MGTFGGALEARQIPAAGGKLVAETVGEVETEENVLVIRRIHVKLLLETPPENRQTAERVHGIFADRCPVYRSLKNSIAMTTELVFTEGPR
jgi:organic hydroperoxide reductase OsmC/OhrA